MIAISIGIAKKVRTLVWLGISGILITVILYGSLFYFGFYQRGGIYDDLRHQMAVGLLNGNVKNIEYYKLQNGHYPAHLADLTSKNPMDFSSTQDPTAIERGGSVSDNFYYELDPGGSFYYLRSVGPDGIPFTADDILPTLPEDELKKTGLRLKK